MGVCSPSSIAGIAILLAVAYYLASQKTYEEIPEIPSVFFDDFQKNLKDLTGEVVAITGTTSGTGYIAAKTVAQKGAKVLLLNRKSSRSTASLQKLQSEVPTGNFVAIECDLQDFESVRNAAKEVKKEVADTGLDVLCLNAGVMALDDKATKDGYDVQMQTNHISHFLLTKELFSDLEKAADKRGEARVVSHSSGARKFPNTPFDPEHYKKNGGQLGGNDEGMVPFGGPRWERYHQTKLANCVFTYALDDRIKAAGSKVKACVAHPGLASTNLQHTTVNEGGMGTSFTHFLMTYFSQSASDGTMGILRCMAGKDVKSGDFYGPLSLTGEAITLEPEEFLYDPVSKDTLWRLSEEAVGKFEL